MDREELKDYLVNETDGYTREEVENMSNKELFDAYLNWNGLIGWTDTILDMVENLFMVELND